ncbi:nucleoside hydrolase [Nocardia takedensis]
MTRPLPYARPPATAGSPLLLCTDIGGGADDAVAVTCAAGLREFVAALTADEIGGERARLLRHQLGLLGRPDVAVTAGADLANVKYWVMGGVTPHSIVAQPRDVVGTVRRVCASTTGPIRWVGCGPMTNLARVLRAAPELAERLVVTQMGGAITSYDGRAEHNFRLDPDAARYVIAHARYLSLVLADVTFTEAIALYPGHPIHTRLTAPGAPGWARLLVEHIERWHTTLGRTTKMHDPMALSLALGNSFVRMEPHPILVEQDGRLRIDPDHGRLVNLSTSADYSAFMIWLSRQLDWTTARRPVPGDELW